MFKKGNHLTYCSNIHPGESWKDTFENLKQYLPNIKKELSPNQPFGIGLRLSNEASLELSHSENIEEFQRWLSTNDYYVFTLNGFPYGGFHHQVIKDEVHRPDWSTKERLAYTERCFDILAELLPEGMDGSISTSPLSYRFWQKNDEQTENVIRKSTLHLADITEKLHRIYQSTGKLLHLDIEPEPDGVLENSQEVIAFYQDWLIPIGSKYLIEKLRFNPQEAEKCLKEHIRICYDICHFSVEFENHEEVSQAFHQAGIKIGKIQISAALKVNIPKTTSQKSLLKETLLPFVESTYLHQVVERTSQGNLNSYRDLPDALDTLMHQTAEEWRIHFHVPVFLSDYGKIASTQQDIKEVLEYISTTKLCNHLEVETYTWEVLPEDINLDLGSSIIRELQWVEENIDL